MKKKRKPTAFAASCRPPEPVLSNRVLVKLLETDSKHNALIDELERTGVDLEALRINLLEIVLDAMQVPPDNTVELEKKYGHLEAMKHPSIFCRDYLTNKWFETNHRTKKEIQDYLLWVHEKLCERSQ